MWNDTQVKSEMFGRNELKSQKYLVLEIWYRNKVPSLNEKTKIIDLNLATFKELFGEKIMAATLIIWIQKIPELVAQNNQICFGISVDHEL